MTDDTSPGWRTDPSGRHEHRYWDGEQWTDLVADAGVSGVDQPGALPRPGEAAAAPAWEPSGSHVPTSSGPSAPSGRSTRRGRGFPIVLVAVAAVVIVAVVFVIGRATGDSEGDRVADRIASVLKAGGIAEDQADCIADHVVDAMGTDDLGRVDDFSASEVPEGLSEDFPAEFTKAQTEAMAECGLDLSGTLGG